MWRRKIRYDNKKQPTRVKGAEEKAQRQVEKIARQPNWATCRAFNQWWSKAAVAKASNSVHQLIKSKVAFPPGSYISRFLWFCPDICRMNQAIVIEQRHAKRERRQLDLSLRTMSLLGCISTTNTMPRRSSWRIDGL